MTPPPYSFRVFDLNKYREIQPVIADILNSSVDAERLKVLLKEAINIVEGEEFKKYNDKSMRTDYEVFQSMMSLIDENRFEEWTEKKNDDWEEYYPANVATRFVEVLCCPKYQVFYNDNLPRSETTFQYPYFADSFYSPRSYGRDIYSLIQETGVEDISFNESFCFFNFRQLAKFSKIISDEYELLRDPENTLYAIHKKNPDDQGDYMASVLFSSPPTDEYLEGKYYALPDSIRHKLKTDFYERIINFLISVKPGFTILNDFCFG
jgi:hypothetical protein